MQNQSSYAKSSCREKNSTFSKNIYSSEVFKGACEYFEV